MKEEKFTEVTKLLGDGRYELKCDDEIKQIGLIRGIMRRHLNIQKGDKVIVNVIKYEQYKCEIIGKIGNSDKYQN